MRTHTHKYIQAVMQCRYISFCINGFLANFDSFLMDVQHLLRPCDIYRLYIAVLAAIVTLVIFPVGRLHPLRHTQAMAGSSYFLMYHAFFTKRAGTLKTGTIFAKPSRHTFSGIRTRTACSSPNLSLQLTFSCSRQMACLSLNQTKDFIVLVFPHNCCY